MTDHHLNQLGFNSQHKAAFWQLVGAPTDTTTIHTQTSNGSINTATQTIGHANEIATAPTITTATVTITNTGVTQTTGSQESSSVIKAPAVDKASYLKNRKIVRYPNLGTNEDSVRCLIP